MAQQFVLPPAPGAQVYPITATPTTGTVPKGFRWNAELARQAAANHEYIRIGPKGGTPLKLSGAAKRWVNKRYPEAKQDIYVTEPYWVAGKREDIERVLLANGIPAGDVQRALANAYTYENFKTEPYKSRAAAEINAYNTYRQQTSSTRTGTAPNLALDDIKYIVEQIITGKAPIVITKGKTETNVVGPLPGSTSTTVATGVTPQGTQKQRGGKRKTPYENLQLAIANNQGVNITNMRVDGSFVGAKRGNIPQRGGDYVIVGLPNQAPFPVFGKYTDPQIVEKYRQFVMAVNPDYAPYVDMFAQAVAQKRAGAPANVVPAGSAGPAVPFGQPGLERAPPPPVPALTQAPSPALLVPPAPAPLKAPAPLVPPSPAALAPAPLKAPAPLVPPAAAPVSPLKPPAPLIQPPPIGQGPTSPLRPAGAGVPSVPPLAGGNIPQTQIPIPGMQIPGMQAQVPGLAPMPNLVPVQGGVSQPAGPLSVSNLLQQMGAVPPPTGAPTPKNPPM